MYALCHDPPLVPRFSHEHCSSQRTLSAWQISHQSVTSHIFLHTVNLTSAPKRRLASPTCTVTSITTWPTASQHLLTYGFPSIILTSGRADTMTCCSDDSGPSCWCTMLPDACHDSNALYWILNTMPANLECCKEGVGWGWTLMCE